MDQAAQITGVACAAVFTFVTILTVSSLWMQHQAKIKAIDMLRPYAERGEEPPASLLETVERLNRPGGPPPPEPTRAQQFARFAGSVVLSIGAGVIVWWRLPFQHGPPGPLMIAAVVAAIFFAGAAAAQLVAALTTRDER
jgi:hypothetical protein